MKVWFDAEGDFLEVCFSDAPGYMKATADDAVMERVDEQGRVIGFSIMHVSKLARQKPLTAELVEHKGQSAHSCSFDFSPDRARSVGAR